jgi:periplasmic protein TonB
MRRHFTLFSVVAHAVVIAAVLVSQELAVGALPTPHQPVLYDFADITPIDIQLPRPARPTAPARAGDTASAPVSPDAAPTVVPTGVAPETGPAGMSTADGPAVGVENGARLGVDGLGIAAPALPPPPPPPVKPMPLHRGMKAPNKIIDVAPAYPAVAQRAHVEGVVILEAVIDEQGRVVSVRVLRSIALLDEAAVDAVKQWRFTPALLNSEPVPVVMTVTVNFTLQGR